MGALLAGTRFRGDFEQRLKAVIGALQKHPGRDPLHRRDPHRRRRRRHQRRLAGRVEHPEAGARLRRAALHRRHHLPGLQELLRARPRPGAPLPEDRGSRADVEEAHEILQGLKGHYEQHHGVTYTRGGAAGRGRTVGQAHQRPAPARQGDRRHRRGRRHAADAAGRPRNDEPRPRVKDIEQSSRPWRRSRRAACRSPTGSGWRRWSAICSSASSARTRRSARWRRRSSWRAPASASRTSRSGRSCSPGPTGRRQDRGGQAAGLGARHRVPALRHERVHGEAHGVAPDRRAAGLRRVRPGRPADRRDPQDAARGAAARRNREGASEPVQHPAAGDGSRHADRQQRPQGRLPQRHPDHDHATPARRRWRRRPSVSAAGRTPTRA